MERPDISVSWPTGLRTASEKWHTTGPEMLIRPDVRSFGSGKPGPTGLGFGGRGTTLKASAIMR